MTFPGHWPEIQPEKQVKGMARKAMGKAVLCLVLWTTWVTALAAQALGASREPVRGRHGMDARMGKNGADRISDHVGTG